MVTLEDEIQVLKQEEIEEGLVDLKDQLVGCPYKLKESQAVALLVEPHLDQTKDELSKTRRLSEAMSLKYPNMFF